MSKLLLNIKEFVKRIPKWFKALILILIGAFADDFSSEIVKLTKDTFFPTTLSTHILSDEELTAKVKDYWGTSEKFEETKIHWTRLDNDSPENVVIISYLIRKKTKSEEDASDQIKFLIDIFRLKDDRLENLFHQSSIDNNLEIETVKIDDKTFFILKRFSLGSGGYAEFSILSYDGKSSFINEYTSDYLFKGNAYVRDNKIFMSGNSRLFSIERHNGHFKEVQVSTKLESDADNGVHVIGFKVNKQKELIVLFDGKEIQFVSCLTQRHRLGCHPEVHTDADLTDLLVVKQPLKINRHEKIVINHNTEENALIRVFEPNKGVLSRKEGFYPTYVSVKPGFDLIDINHDYGKWYGLEFHINE